MRGVLLSREPKRDPGFDLFSLAVEDEVPENALTNFDTLGQTLRKYNASVAKGFRVDESVVDLRDALAHGRVLSAARSFPLRLFKFSKAIGHKVKVTHAETLDLAYLRAQVRRLLDEIKKVQKVMGP